MIQSFAHNEAIQGFVLDEPIQQKYLKTIHYGFKTVISDIQSVKIRYRSDKESLLRIKSGERFMRNRKTVVSKNMQKSTNITVMEEKKVKNLMRKTGILFKKAKNKLMLSVSGGMAGVILMSNTIYAAAGGTASVTQPLENLKTLVIAVIGAVGVIILAKNVMEFAQAYQQQDSSTMNSALKGIVAGVMMAGISTVLTFLGF